MCTSAGFKMSSVKLYLYSQTLHKNYSQQKTDDDTGKYKYKQNCGGKEQQYYDVHRTAAHCSFYQTKFVGLFLLAD